ncbi:MAG: hypothetical protein GEU98_10740 [Pseudonocardiaceae bacterium]|nr:hypothetical protein [Pseudonocardiaceae bacterium]
MSAKMLCSALPSATALRNKSCSGWCQLTSMPASVPTARVLVDGVVEQPERGLEFAVVAGVDLLGERRQHRRDHGQPFRFVLHE